MGKSTISMAIFHSFLLVHQRVIVIPFLSHCFAMSRLSRPWRAVLPGKLLKACRCFLAESIAFFSPDMGRGWDGLDFFLKQNQNLPTYPKILVSKLWGAPSIFSHLCSSFFINQVSIWKLCDFGGVSKETSKAFLWQRVKP